MNDWTAGEAFALGLVAGEQAKADQEQEEAKAIASILGQVDQIVAQESDTLFVAVRVIVDRQTRPIKVSTAFMGIYTSEESAKEVCQRNTKATLKWSETGYGTYWKSNSIMVKVPFGNDDPAPQGSEGQMAYFVSEQKVRK